MKLACLLLLLINQQLHSAAHSHQKKRTSQRTTTWTSARTHIDQARQLLEDRKYSSAVQTLATGAQILEANPNSAETYELHKLSGAAQYHLNKFDEASKSFEKSLEAKSDCMFVLCQIARCKISASLSGDPLRLHEASHMISCALEKNPDHPDLNFYQAMIHLASAKKRLETASISTAPDFFVDKREIAAILTIIENVFGPPVTNK